MSGCGEPRLKSRIMAKPMGTVRATHIRKLAAIDIFFLGYKLVVAEYAGAVLFSPALGVFTLLRSRSLGQIVLGIYLICVGINYVPMLAYTLALGNKQSAQAELGDELAERGKAMPKYRRVSLLLLVPLWVPILAVADGRLKSPGVTIRSK